MTAAEEFLQKNTEEKLAEAKKRQERENLICNRFKELRAKFPFCTQTKVEEAVALEFKLTRQGVRGIIDRNNNSHENIS